MRAPRADGPRTRASLAALEAAGLVGLTPAELAARLKQRESRGERLLVALLARERVVHLARPEAYVARTVADVLTVRALERAVRAHQEAPWALGMTSLALARALIVTEALLVRGLAPGVERGLLGYRGGYYAAPGFSPCLTHEQDAFFERAVSVDCAHPFTPVPYARVLAAMRASELPGVLQACETLYAAGKLVRVGEFLYREAQITAVRELVEASLGAGKGLTPAAFRDLLGTSRKYAVPLLEWCDAVGITIRAGDVRAAGRTAQPR